MAKLSIPSAEGCPSSSSNKVVVMRIDVSQCLLEGIVKSKKRFEFQLQLESFSAFQTMTLSHRYFTIN